MEIKSDLLRAAYNGSYYTIVGAGGDPQVWKNGYEAMMSDADIGKPKEWVTFTGADVNSEFSLKGRRRFKDDLHFLAFPLDGLNVPTLAVFKIRMGDRWFDDIVNNSILV